jgi:hypothetical protein
VANLNLFNPGVGAGWDICTKNRCDLLIRSFEDAPPDRNADQRRQDGLRGRLDVDWSIERRASKPVLGFHLPVSGNEHSVESWKRFGLRPNLRHP